MREESLKNVTDLINTIALGVDPTTGGKIDLNILRRDGEFLNALSGLREKVNPISNSNTYRQIEEMFPNHVVILQEGYFYKVHNYSAFVINHLMDYKIIIDSFGRPTTGGPDYEKITSELKKAGVSYVLIIKREVFEIFEGENPFEQYGIDDLYVNEMIEKYRNTLRECEESNEVAIEINKKDLKEKKEKKKYPSNLLEKVFAKERELPVDIEERVNAVLNSDVAGWAERDFDCILQYYRDGKTLEQIGNEYGLSRERIRQLIGRGIKRMRSKKVAEYLTGETDIMPMKLKNEVTNKNKELKINDYDYIKEDGDIPFFISPVSDDAISISKLCSNIYNEGLIEKVLKYDFIMAWFHSEGCIAVYEKNEKKYYVPTEKGDAIGIKRGFGRTSEGREFLGIILEPSAQQYIRENINGILEFQMGS